MKFSFFIYHRKLCNNLRTVVVVADKILNGVEENEIPV